MENKQKANTIDQNKINKLKTSKKQTQSIKAK